MAETVRIKGLKELQRDFKRISKDLDKRLTSTLKDAAEPVRNEASMLALGRIRNMPRSPQWAGMRIGVSRAKGSVYVTPKARRRGGSKRPNLGKLLVERAMDPAVEQKQDGVVRALGQMVDDIADGYGF